VRPRITLKGVDETLGIQLAGKVLSIVVMGVSGSGKSTVGEELSRVINGEFIDADWLHSPANLAKMSTGHELSDEDRTPWLHSLGQLMQEVAAHNNVSVVACSALKRSYRDVLREFIPDTFFVFLDGPVDVIRARMNARHSSFMPSSLLDSQFAILEPLEEDEAGMRVDITLSSDEIVHAVAAQLKL
jgi:carbohydrate kinase (thermoresistant glucokinase family)